jgi:hypothetical protein
MLGFAPKLAPRASSVPAASVVGKDLWVWPTRRDTVGTDLFVIPSTTMRGWSRSLRWSNRCRPQYVAPKTLARSRWTRSSLMAVVHHELNVTTVTFGLKLLPRTEDWCDTY